MFFCELRVFHAHLRSRYYLTMYNACAKYLHMQKHYNLLYLFQKMYLVFSQYFALKQFDMLH